MGIIGQINPFVAGQKLSIVKQLYFSYLRKFQINSSSFLRLYLAKIFKNIILASTYFEQHNSVKFLQF